MIREPFVFFIEYQVLHISELRSHFVQVFSCMHYAHKLITDFTAPICTRWTLENPRRPFPQCPRFPSTYPFNSHLSRTHLQTRIPVYAILPGFPFQPPPFFQPTTPYPPFPQPETDQPHLKSHYCFHQRLHPPHPAQPPKHSTQIPNPLNLNLNPNPPPFPNLDLSLKIYERPLTSSTQNPNICKELCRQLLRLQVICNGKR